MKSLIIIPAYNEELNIESVIDSISEAGCDYDYLVVNDSSTDGTEEVLNQNSFNYVSLPVNLGIGGAVQTGYKYARDNGYDVAIQMDGDGQHNPEYYKEAVDIIEQGEADIVIGSRFIEKEGFQTSFMRRFGIKLLSIMIKIVCGETVRDVTSGYRIVNRKFIEYFAEEYAQDYPEPEAIVAAKLNGAVIKEIPVIMNEREEGESSISPLKSVIYMIKVTLAIIFYRFTVKRARL